MKEDITDTTEPIAPPPRPQQQCMNALFVHSLASIFHCQTEMFASLMSEMMELYFSNYPWRF